MQVRGGVEIDWRRLADGTLVYEKPFAALDGDRFDRIARGFDDHYVVEWRAPDAFGFGRGEGYISLERWDAFGYVDRGVVERVHGDAISLPETGIDVAVLPAGWKAIRFTLNMRVILVFWAFLLVVFWFLVDAGPTVLWVGGFFLIYGMHLWLVMRSLDRKLATWMMRESLH